MVVELAKLMVGADIAPKVKGLIHEGKQVKDVSVDLTVKCVYCLDGRGRLDFGGGEYAGFPLR